LRRKADDLEELLGPKLTRDGPEDAGSDRLLLVVDEHRAVRIEANQAAIGAPQTLARANDHGLHDRALLHAAVGQRVADRDDAHVADVGVATFGAPEHLDAKHLACPGVVRNVEDGLYPAQAP